MSALPQEIHAAKADLIDALDAALDQYTASLNIFARHFRSDEDGDEISDALRDVSPIKEATDSLQSDWLAAETASLTMNKEHTAGAGVTKKAA